MKYKLFVLTFILASCNHGSETVKPVVKPLMEAVYASGYVVARNQYEVFAQAEGYIGEKLVKDGDDVKKGDPIYIIENDQQNSRYTLARENYLLAKRNFNDDSPVLRELKAGMETVRTKMQFDSINLVRYSNLLKSNATTQSEYDRIKLAYDNSKNEYLSQRSRLERTRNELYIDLENAKSQLAIVSVESGRYIVRSDIDGKVFKTMKEKGELIRRNEAIAVIGDKESFYLELNVDELDIRRVNAGQKVLVKIDAFPEKVLNARVDKVFPMVNQEQQSLRVDALFTDTMPAPISGLAVEANIIVREKDKALVIPKTALLPGDSVLVSTEDGAKKIKVVKGIETLDEVEIIKGLDSSQELIVRR